MVKQSVSKNLSLLKCHPWNHNDFDDEEYMWGGSTGEKESVSTTENASQLILHWYDNNEVVVLGLKNINLGMNY